MVYYIYWKKLNLYFWIWKINQFKKKELWENININSNNNNNNYFIYIQKDNYDIIYTDFSGYIIKSKNVKFKV